MQLSQNLNISQRLSQKLTMNLKMQQAIALLPLSAQELMEQIYEELENNPVLEIDDEANIKDQVFMQYYESAAAAEGLMPGLQFDRDEEAPAQQFAAPGPSLQEYLIRQLRLNDLSGIKQRIGEIIIGQIDGDGYLQGDLAAIARAAVQPLAEIEAMLSLIQKFDPPGVGARNLSECLLVQVAQLGWSPEYPARELVQCIIGNHLDDVAASHHAQTAKSLGVSVAEVQRVVDFIKTLEPKPGRSFSGSGVEYITPDIFVEKVDGQYVVIVENSVCPNLRINRYYQQLLTRKKELDSDTYTFIKGKLDAAFWFVRSIEQRRLTMQRIMESILQFQYDFFEKGVSYLKPLTLKQVADAIGMHESTVSRATTRKYAQTPLGVFELKFFFNNGFAQGNGQEVAAETIKKMLQEMIMAEDAGHPLSDQKIADIFQRRKINISRRTVAKYRDELHIASSSRRRRYC